jgi:hypothetical protein
LSPQYGIHRCGNCFWAAACHLRNFLWKRRCRLYEIFRPEVEELEGMINRDLSGWKSISEEILTASQSA